jgi:hypothetical protein
VLSDPIKYSFLFEGFADCLCEYKAPLLKYGADLETLLEKAAQCVYKILFNEKLKADEFDKASYEITEKLMQIFLSYAPNAHVRTAENPMQKLKLRMKLENDQIKAKRDKEIIITQKRLIIADKTNRPITSVTHKDIAAYDLEVEKNKKEQLKKESAEADKNIAELLASLENETKKKDKSEGSRNKGKKTASKKTKSRKPRTVFPADTQNKKDIPITVPKKKKKTPSASKVTGVELRIEFVASLYQKSIKELDRVTNRWMTHDPEIIRHFIDFDKNGVEIKRYIGMNDEEIEKQRAFHFLPGLEKILVSKVHKKIYTFPTSRGCGVYADLIRGRDKHLGVIYFGIGVQDRVVFHKYFEEKQMNDPDFNGTFKDKEEIPKNNNNNEPGWECTTEQTFEMDEKGVLTINFDGEDHYIRLYPVRKDLIKPELLKK